MRDHGYARFARPWKPEMLEASRGMAFGGLASRNRVRAAHRHRERGTRFEIECYGTAHLHTLSHLVARDLATGPLFVVPRPRVRRDTSDGLFDEPMEVLRWLMQSLEGSRDGSGLASLFGGLGVQPQDRLRGVGQVRGEGAPRAILVSGAQALDQLQMVVVPAPEKRVRAQQV